tara:strand:+ start:87 stop:449 length:363 start_codon:yes stop_codon:yes gene_type:complete
MASFKNLEAALMQLRGKALEHYGAIEILINNPTGISGHTDYVAEIIRHAKGLAECEEAYGTLTNHFAPKADPAPTPQAPPPTPKPAPGTKTVVTPENSPTMKRALKTSTARKSREKKTDG